MKFCLAVPISNIGSNPKGPADWIAAFPSRCGDAEAGLGCDPRMVRQGGIGTIGRGGWSAGKARVTYRLSRALKVFECGGGTYRAARLRGESGGSFGMGPDWIKKL